MDVSAARPLAAIVLIVLAAPCSFAASVDAGGGIRLWYTAVGKGSPVIAIPMAMVSEWVRAMPHARILRLAGTGHFPHAERPSIVFPAIETFLRDQWPAAATAR